MTDLTSCITMCNSPKSAVANISLPYYPCTINLILPCGKMIEIKYSIEHPSLDIDFPEDLIVTNWKSDMMPAEAVSGLTNDAKGLQQFSAGHVRISKMLNINLRPEHLINQKNN